MKISLRYWLAISVPLSILLGLAFITQIDLSTQVRGLLPLASVPNLPASQITSGQIALARGGTNADLSGTGGTSQVLKQTSLGAAVTVAQLAFTDLSGSASVAQIPNLPASIITSGQLALARGGTNADLSGTGGSAFVLKQLSAGAAVTVAQLAFTEISGSVAASQLPNPTASTLGGIESYAAVSNQWINAISTSGVPSSTQPAFSNLSGTIAGSQFPTLSGSTYFFGGLPLGSPAFISNGSAAVVIANRVEVALFYLSAPVSVKKLAIHVTTGTAASTANIGIYDSTGTSLLIDSGSLATTGTNANVSATLTNAVVLAPGFYFYAFACTSVTPTFRTLFNVSGTGTGGELLNLNQNRFYIGGNSLSGGALPSSIGTVTTNGSQNIKEAIFESI